MLRQYLDLATRARIRDMLECAGAKADAAHPLVHVSYEWDDDHRVVELVLTMWPHGERRLLAHLDPYGDQVIWLG